jgi:deoxyribonuclease-4
MIRIGPSGNSDRFYELGYKHTFEAAKWLKEIGLNAFEYSFGRGVKISEDTAKRIAAEMNKHDIALSVHAPYYTNLANPDDEMVKKTFSYVEQSIMAVKMMGGNRVVFHPASEGKAGREDAVKLTKERLIRLTDRLYEYGYQDVKFCPETMGKLRQIGTVEEIIDFCKIDKIYTPCIDFGHINARENGTLNTKQDFLDRLNFMIDELGFDRVTDMHVHFSKIQYTAKGEVRHLTFDDELYGPRFEPFIEAVKELGLTPYIICESAGTQAEDALKMKEYYKIV